MLSAKSNDRIYVAGSIPDPQSRPYTCIHCAEALSYVSPHTRGGMERVTEHFRHGKKVEHAVRERSGMEGEAIDFLIKRLSAQYGYEVFTDYIYTTNRGEQATDLLIREHRAEGKYIDTVIQVEANPFNYNDYNALHSALSRAGIPLAVVLCAKNENNPNGAFFVDEFRSATRKTVKDFGKNERALIDRFGEVPYFMPGRSVLQRVIFHDYEERLQKDITSPSGRIIKEAGTMQTFVSKKEPSVTRTFGEQDPIRLYRKSNGLILARFRSPIIDDYFEMEKLALERKDENRAEEFGERVSIMLDSASVTELQRLAHKYGEKALGSFALKLR